MRLGCGAHGSRLRTGLGCGVAGAWGRQNRLPRARGGAVAAHTERGGRAYGVPLRL